MDYKLTINRDEFLSALRLIKRVSKARPSQKALLTLEAESLHMELDDMAVTVKAQGSWPGKANVNAGFILVMAKVPPSGDPVEIVADDHTLRIGTSTTGCTWITKSVIP